MVEANPDGAADMAATVAENVPGAAGAVAGAIAEADPALAAEAAGAMMEANPLLPLRLLRVWRMLLLKLQAMLLVQ